MGLARSACGWVHGIVALLGLVVPHSAAAQDRLAKTASVPVQSWETWAGAEAVGRAWSAYSGLTMAPFGPIQADGFRLRTVAGYGSYGYETHRWTGRELVPHTVKGTATFADAFIGYQYSHGALTLKLFAGIAMEGHQLSPADPYNPVQGIATGAKVVAESWLNWTDDLWSSVDLAWSTVFDGRSARLRSGYRITPWLSIGAEAAYIGNIDYDAGRGGIFVRADWPAGEFSVSAGLSADRTGAESAYGTVNWLIRY